MSKRTYGDYVHADTGWSFADWLGIDPPRRDYNDRNLVRLTSSRAQGEYRLTLKDAKVSYKAALKKRKEGAK